MDTEKLPTITRELVDKSTSDEAIEKLRKIDFEYQKKQQELDTTQQVQDGNFYMGKLIGLHNEKDAAAYAQNKQHAQVLLYDHYMCEAEKTYEEYHPDGKEPDDTTAKEKDDLDNYKKGYNESYVLFHENKELAQSLDRSFDDKDLPRAEGFLHCSKDLTEKEITAELDDLENRNMDKDMSKDRTRDYAKDNQPDTRDTPDKDKD